MTSSLLSDLAAIVGESHVLTDQVTLDGAAVDWTGRYVGHTPAVVAPSSTAEVAEIVAVCRRNATALVPQGGNTGLVGGGVPHGEVVLSTRRMGVVAVDEAAGQVTAGAGATIAAVQEAASESGWRYGIDLASRGSATVGGTIATNAGGMHVIRFGATRQQLIGVEAVLGSGEVVSRLDGLVKDNTGYDLAGLLCGSEGTLGVVTRARLRLVAPDPVTTTALIGFRDVEAAVAAVAVLRRRVAHVSAVELVLESGVDLVADTLDVAVPVRGAALVVVEAAADVDALAGVVETLEGVADTAVATEETARAKLWAVRELHTEAISRLGVALKFDVTVPANAMASTIAEMRTGIDGLAPGLTAWIFGHAADGNIHVNVTGAASDDVPLIEAVESFVLGHIVDVGGSISAEHGIGRAKLPWLARNRSVGDVAAMKRLKGAFDPDGILNPGVLIPARAD